MSAYIDQNRACYMVEPICRTLEIAPSSYYAARSRPPSARTLADEELKLKISEIHRENFAVYGARKVWRALARKGEDVGRDRVARRMGTQPSSSMSSAVGSSAGGWRPACGPISLSTLSRWPFAREATSLRDSSTIPIAGVQYLDIRYTERLAQAGVVNSVGPKGDSYDNAIAETVNGLYKTELIRRRRSWRSSEEVELATATWVHWWNESWLHSACGDIPPAEFEEAYHRQLAATVAA